MCISVRPYLVVFSLEIEVFHLKQIVGFKPQLKAELISPPAIAACPLRQFKFIDEKLPIKGVVLPYDIARIDAKQGIVG